MEKVMNIYRRNCNSVNPSTFFCVRNTK